MSVWILFNVDTCHVKSDHVKISLCQFFQMIKCVLKDLLEIPILLEFISLVSFYNKNTLFV